MTYHIYSIESHETPDDTYVGITRDIDIIRSHHETCSEDGKSKLYEHIRSHGGWKNFFIRHVSSHETYEDAKNKKSFGSLNEYRSNEYVRTIYKIFCRDPKVTELYIGQTIDFDSRRDSHCVASMIRHLKVYEFIRSHGGWSNWKMVRVCEYPHCKDREELDRLEWYWWVKLGGELNTIIPGHISIFEKYKYKEKLFEKTEEYERMVVDDVVPRKNFFIKSISLEI